MMGAAVVSAACIALGALATWSTWREARALGAYLAAVIAEGLVPLMAPSAATPAAFVAFESVVAALRFGVGFEVARHMAAALPGVRGRIYASVLVALGATVALVTWGRVEPSGERSAYRALALAATGSGLLLLGLRVLALRYRLDLPLVFRATAPLGAYLVAHGLLLGAATEAAKVPLAASVSAALWCAWALWLALSAWAARKPA